MSCAQFHNEQNVKQQPIAAEQLKIFMKSLIQERWHKTKKSQINCENKYFKNCEEIFDSINQLEVAKVINIGASPMLNLAQCTLLKKEPIDEEEDQL